MSKWKREPAASWIAVGLSGLAVLAAAGCSSAKDSDEDTNPVGQGSAGMFVGSSGAGGASPGGGGIGAGMAGVGAAGLAGPAGTGSPAAGGGAGMSAAGMGGASGMSAAGMGGAGGMADGEAGAGGQPMAHQDLGQGDGKDVITIGDSWMNLILTGIEQSLEAKSGRDYRNYAVPGTLVLNEQIPDQYDAAIAENPVVKTIVMTGGGNDILTSPCVDDECEPIVDDVVMRLNQLMMQAGEDGVEDIILIGYTYPADMGKHASLDYSIMLSKQTCTKDSKPRCHFLDSTKLAITLQDGIHPNPAGYDLIGETVWALMQAEGVRR
ncbi:MAG TPA: SGNH/GDSL hydrolase family protein [Polyangiales bacterium]|nr:SGNH/GDSL hydrolase family protein [Polyangiales bacterium]